MSQIRGSERSQHNQAKHRGRNILGMVFPGYWAHTFAVNHVFLQWMFSSTPLAAAKPAHMFLPFPYMYLCCSCSFSPVPQSFPLLCLHNSVLLLGRTP